MTAEKSTKPLLFLLTIFLSSTLVCGIGYLFFLTTEQTQQITYRVIGPSMAPTILGPHRDITCDECQVSFSIDATIKLPELVTCPNCGFQKNDVQQGTVNPGDLLELSPLIQTPKRFDLVALPIEDNGKEVMTVKRLVGLPGETVAIKHGDLYIDQQLIVKSMEQFKQMAIAVYDQKFFSNDRNPFQTEGENWIFEPGVLKFKSQSLVENQENEPLWYQQYACLPAPHLLTHLSTPQDGYGYNPSLSRQLFPVTDLIVCGTLDGESVRNVQFTFHADEMKISGELDWQNKVLTIRHQSEVVSTAKLDTSVQLPIEFSCGYLDGRFILQTTNETKKSSAEYRLEVEKWSQRPFSIEATGTEIELQNVLLQRDLYYLSPHQRNEDWSMKNRLEENSVFLLGDNVPLSSDSREWSVAASFDKLLIVKRLMQ